MAGLLGNIQKAVQGLLGNEFVQGAAGAAAFGANPLVGLLAGPVIKGSRDRYAQENEDRRRSLAARERLPELLAQRTESQTLPGMGLLNLEDDSVQQLPGRRAQGLYANTVEGQAELQGLLTDIAPQTAVQGMLANQRPPAARSAPAVVRVADELGLTGKERDQFIRDNFNPNVSTESMQSLIDLQRAQLELQRSTDERDQENAQREVKRRQFGNSLHTTIDNLFELSAVNDQLAGTGQRPGFGAGARSGIGSAVAFGADMVGADQFAGDVQANVDLAERFDTLANEILIDSLNTGNFDARLESKFRAFASTKPDRENQGSRANSLAIADKFDAALLAADANGEFIPEERRAKVEAEIKRLREFQLSPASILQMPFEDVLGLDEDEIDRWTPEQQQALDIRLRQFEQGQ